MNQDHALVCREAVGSPVEVFFQKRNSVAVVIERIEDGVGEGENTCSGRILDVCVKNFRIRCNGEGCKGVGVLPALQYPTEFLEGVLFENIGKNRILGNSVKFCVCPDFFVDWITVAISSCVDSGGLLKEGCFVV